VNFLQAWAARNDRYSVEELAERIGISPAEFESAMRGEDVAAAAEQALANRFQQTYAELVVDPLATARARKAAEKAQAAVQNARRRRPVGAVQRG